MATISRTAFDYSSAGDHALYGSENWANSEFAVATGNGEGQSFIGDGRTLDSVEYYVRSVATTGTMEARIYAHSGTYGSSSVGTGSPLAISETIDVSSLSNVRIWRKVDFTGSNRIVLESGTNYVVVLFNNSLDSSGFIRSRTTGTAVAHVSTFLSGNRCSLSETTFTSQSYDLIIRVATASTVWKIPVLRTASGSGVGTAVAVGLKLPNNFEPPADDRFPWADYRQNTADHDLFGYVRQGVRAQNLFRLKTGEYTNVDPRNPDLVDIVYYGGHRYKVTVEEIADLTAAGYGAYIS